MHLNDVFEALPVMRQFVMMRKEVLALPEAQRPRLDRTGTMQLTWGEIMCLGQLFDGIVQSIDKVHNDNSINTKGVSIELEIKLDGRIRKKIETSTTAPVSSRKELLGVRP